MWPSRLLSLLIGCILTLALAACGGGDSDDPETTSTPSASETASTPASEGSSAGDPDAAESSAPGEAESSTDSSEPASGAPDAAGAEETLRTFLTAYSEGDAATACELSLPAYSDANIKMVGDQGGLKPDASCEELYEWAHGFMVAMDATLEPVGLTVTVQGNKATAPATYDGDKFTYFLTFIDGSWLITGDSDVGYFGDQAGTS